MADSRFADLTEGEIEDILCNKSAQNTIYATKFASALFFAYTSVKLNLTSTEVESLCNERLDEILCKFFAEVRNTKGEKYSCTTLRCIRSGLQRYFNDPPVNRLLNFVSGSDFVKSQKMFMAVTVDLKKSGLGDIEHKPVIEDEDMERLDNYFSGYETNNQILIHKVWFDLMYFFCRRGREGLRDLHRDSYRVHSDAAGVKYIKKHGSELTKNHRNDAENEGGILYEERDSKSCGVKSYELYRSKLNPDCNTLFQRPKPKYNLEDKVWFENKPVGKNTLGKFMHKISEAAKLSKVYTNHSIRASSVTVLSDAGVEGRHIQTVSGHLSVDSIVDYARDTTLPQKRKMSSVLAQRVYKSSKVSKVLSHTVTSGDNAESHPEANTSALSAVDPVDSNVPSVFDPSEDARIMYELTSPVECPLPPGVNFSDVKGGIFNIYIGKGE